MYSTCLFCHSPLGRNERIENFTVGRRLAFDAYRGRLWVVCRKCENWNLSPLEQRWEAVEECEKLYRDTTVRVSTDNIGLATVSDGMDLVRIGKPLRPEFAAWRYGRRIRTRRFRSMRSSIATHAGEGAAMLMGAGAAISGMTAILTQGRMGMHMLRRFERAEERFSYDRVLARVRIGERVEPLRFSEISRLEIVAMDDAMDWTFRVAHPGGVLDINGPQAVQVAGQILARLNNSVGSGTQLREATRRITEAGDAERFIRQSGALRELRRRKRSIFWDDDIGVLGLTVTERLALEIAVHEDAERQAMQGELAALEEAWRDAEEIAAIADALFVVDGGAETGVI